MRLEKKMKEIARDKELKQMLLTMQSNSKQKNEPGVGFNASEILTAMLQADEDGEGEQVELTAEEELEKKQEAEVIRILTDPKATSEFKKLPYYEF
jgi:hypothetical protein